MRNMAMVSLLSDADEELVWSRAILAIDRAGQVKILKFNISAGRFCHTANAERHGIARDKSAPYPKLRTDADQVDTETVELWLSLPGTAAKRNPRDS